MIEFQKMVCEDADEHIKLQRKAFLPLLEKYQDGDYNPANTTKDIMIERIQKDNGLYFKVLVDGESVGGIYAFINNSEEKEMCLCVIYILPKWQGKHLATKAIEYLESVCPDYKKWFLEVPEKEMKNRHLYEKFGYRDSGEKIKVNDKLTLMIYKKQSV